MDGLVPVVGITPPIEKVLESRDDFWFIYFEKHVARFLILLLMQFHRKKFSQKKSNSSILSLSDYINIRAFAPLFWPKPRVLDDPVLLSPPVVG